MQSVVFKLARGSSNRNLETSNDSLKHCMYNLHNFKKLLRFVFNIRLIKARH